MKRLAILLLLLASTTQAFVAQTHVHAALFAQAAHQASPVEAGDQQLPGNGGEAGCLLCQIAAHGAAALVSDQSIVLKEIQQHVVAALSDSSDPVSLPLTHSWLSRGPPRT